MDKRKINQFLKTLGPGILFASTAIGVSHLVQSTRAGANFGFALVPFIIAANLFKYPFFEFGSRYANATGRSIIDGYRSIGKWMLTLYLLITLGSMFFVSAAVGAVTAGFMQNLFGLSISFKVTTLVLFMICAFILAIGKYSALDKLIKIIGAVLLVSTLIAFVLALLKGQGEVSEGFQVPDIWSEGSIFFIIALMGWMPTAVDLSAWNSLWTIERIKETGYRPTLKETLGDFNFGYIISAVLSICFVTLGAFMLYGSGIELPQRSGDFAHAIIGLYTGFIGEWSYILIAAAAFAIMFGTCIAIFDGYSRSLTRTMELFLKREAKGNNSYVVVLIIVVLGSFGIIYFFGAKMKQLVDIATTVSFLIAPVIAIVNYKLVIGDDMPAEAKPPVWLRILSISGILFLTAFALYFIWLKVN